ncbi:unnamed protein product, partial [Prorocentrum cordatum]
LEMAAPPALRPGQGAPETPHARGEPWPPPAPLQHWPGGAAAEALEQPAPAELQDRPERPRCRGKPPFAWQLAPDYEAEFLVTGDASEIVTKVGDFRERDWVVPVGSTLRLSKGGLYRWTLCLERLCLRR